MTLRPNMELLVLRGHGMPARAGLVHARMEARGAESDRKGLMRNAMVLPW
jgi:hypothetical protein